MTAPPLLAVRNLGRTYSSPRLFGASGQIRALDDVSLTMQPGRIFGIVGESGSGKSTLARLVMALDRPSSGQVLFEGDDLFALTPRALRDRRRNLQMVFQDPNASLDPRQTIGRIVAEPLHLLETRPSRNERDLLVAQMLEDVGMPAYAAGRYPHQFSGGQRQRIAIARALITRPKLVVADEPVSALDLSVQAHILNLILDLRDRWNTAFLFISHDLSVIDCVADDVAVMRQGRIVETGAARDVFDNPQDAYTRDLVMSDPSAPLKQ